MPEMGRRPIYFFFYSKSQYHGNIWKLPDKTLQRNVPFSTLVHLGHAFSLSTALRQG